MLKSPAVSALFVFALIGVLTVCSFPASAADSSSISANQAESLVQNWLSNNPRPLNEAVSAKVSGATLYYGSRMHSAYYVVNLQSGGFVIVAADDRIEPILCFGGKGHYIPSSSDPLAEMLDEDIYHREIDANRPGAANAVAAKRVHGKWQYLLGASAGSGSTADNTSIGNSPGPSDVQVAPFIQSQWDQSTSYFGNCYNYWTPNNDVCGCVATALAQVLRYYDWPTTAVGTESYECTVDGNPVNLSLRGGDGKGGAYVWSEMPLTPDTITTESPALQTDYSEIGDLCYDTGVVSEMEYTSGSSGAYLDQAQQGLVGPFNYSNAIYLDYGVADDAMLIQMINPDLDAGLPVVLGIYNSTEGHCVIADGYGFDTGTLYHHLNVGWGTYFYNLDSIWYNLADPDITSDDFNIVGDAIYNIDPTGSGEVLSGIVYSNTGTPLTGATVTASDGSKTWTTKSGANGIYAFHELLPNEFYTVSGSYQGAVTNTLSLHIGQSSGSGPASLWGYNLTIVAAPPKITSIAPQSGPIGSTLTINGTNLGGATLVTFTGGSTAVPTATTSTTATVVVPAAAQSGPVTITTSGGTATSSQSFTIAVPPTITSITPQTVVAGASNTVITITGTTLAGTTGATWNGSPLTHLSSTATTVTGTIPAADLTSAAAGPISVTTPTGTAQSVQQFTVFGVPVITAFTPTSGIAGTSVTIFGSNLALATSVTWDGQPLTNVQSSSDEVTGTVAGAGLISNTSAPFIVTNYGGTTTSAAEFTVIPPPTILSFSPTEAAVGSSSATVTLSGVTLSNAAAVSWNGLNIPITGNTSTTITCVIPGYDLLSQVSAPFIVSTNSGSIRSPKSFSVVTGPTITSFSPQSGPAGTEISFSGTNLTGASEVIFTGGSIGLPTSVTATSAEVYVPSGAKTGPFTVTTPVGTAASPNAFTVIPSASITAISPSFVLAGSAATKITVTGTNLSGLSSVTWNGYTLTNVTSSSTKATALIAAAALKTPASALVYVTGLGGTAASPGYFTVYGKPVITSIAPTSGPMGTVVTITGTGLSGASKVTFAGGAVGTPSGFGSTCTVRVPSGAKTGTISITTPGGMASSAQVFTVIVAPKITSFTPASVPHNSPATKVTINGSNLTGVTSATWNHDPLTIVSVTSSSVVATLPAADLKVAASAPIAVTNAAGTATSSASFVVR